MLLEILCLLILCIPTAWALWDDRNGDIHPNHDLVIICLLTVGCSFIAAVINEHTNASLDYLRSLILSACIYISLFPYLVNLMLYKRGIINAKNWYDHLSATAWPDRLKIWSETPWYGRMFLLFVILSGAIMIYVCPFKVISYDNSCFCSCVD